VQRAASVLPKQGDRGPWRVHQNYLADMLNLRWGRLEDGVLQLSGHGKSVAAGMPTATD